MMASRHQQMDLEHQCGFLGAVPSTAAPRDSVLDACSSCTSHVFLFRFGVRGTGAGCGLLLSIFACLGCWGKVGQLNLHHQWLRLPCWYLPSCLSWFAHTVNALQQQVIRAGPSSAAACMQFMQAPALSAVTNYWFIDACHAAMVWL